MKKIVSFIMVFMMALMLVACGESSTVTIKYETNGGNTITSTEINLDDLKSFNLPSEPTKEGYVFVGWYLDSDFKEEFQSLDNVKKDITLYAKWEEQSTVYTVKFVDGDEEINTVSVKEGEKVSEPTAPTKEGYVFAGWYNGYNMYDFETAVTENLVLTAKWNNTGSLEDIKSVSGKIELINKLEVTSDGNSVFEEMNEWITILADSKTTLELVVNNINTENLKDIEAYLNCSLEINGALLNSENNPKYACELYVKNGIVYAKVATEAVDNPTNLNVQINIEKLIKALETLIQENIGDEEIDFQEQYNELIQELQGKLTEILALAAECGLDTEFYNALVALLSILKPVAVEDNAKITYSITNDQVQSFLTNLGKFVEKYMVQMYKFVNSLDDIFNPEFEPIDEIDDNVIDFGDYKVVKGENGWYDADGTFHSFAEDEEYFYGYPIAGYYVDYAFRCVYDINNNYALVDAYCISGFDYETEEFYNAIFFQTEEGDYFVYENNEEIAKKNVSEDFLKQDFGYVHNGIYYIYYEGGAVYYSIETGKKLTLEEIEAMQAAAMSEQILATIDTIKECITINKFNVSVSKGLVEGLNGSFSFDTDIDLTISEDETYNVKEYFEFNILSNILLENTTIEFPSFVGFFDITDTLIGYLQPEL